MALHRVVGLRLGVMVHVPGQPGFARNGEIDDATAKTLRQHGLRLEKSDGIPAPTLSADDKQQIEKTRAIHRRLAGQGMREALKPLRKTFHDPANDHI